MIKNIAKEEQRITPAIRRGWGILRKILMKLGVLRSTVAFLLAIVMILQNASVSLAADITVFSNENIGTEAASEESSAFVEVTEQTYASEESVNIFNEDILEQIEEVEEIDESLYPDDFGEEYDLDEEDLNLDAAQNGYLAFKSSGRFSISIKNNTPKWDGHLFYSFDAIDWNEWDGSLIQSNKSGESYIILFKGKDNTCISGFDGNGFLFQSDTDISCTGNIETLLDYERVLNGLHPTMSSCCFYKLFYNCTGLIKGPELPAVQLTRNCYSYMFYGCKGLKEAPELPAANLEYSCYSYMFYGCKELKEAPVLSATAINNYCYRNMFTGCSGITQAPELPATILFECCYESMFSNCARLTEAPELPAKALAQACYKKMFSRCTGLKRLPELSATKLPDECYDSMFESCHSLIINTSNPGYAWQIPAGAKIGKNSLKGMFVDTGGSYTGDPAPGTMYYNDCGDSYVHLNVRELTNNQSIVVEFSSENEGAADKENYSVVNSDGQSMDISSVSEADVNQYRINFSSPLPAGKYTLSTTGMSNDTGTQFNIEVDISVFDIVDNNHIILQLSSPIIGCNQADNYYVYQLGNYDNPLEIIAAESAFEETGHTPNTFKLTLGEQLATGCTYIVETRNMRRWVNDIEGGQIGNPCQGAIEYFIPKSKMTIGLYALTNNQSVIMKYDEAVDGMYNKESYSVKNSSGAAAVIGAVCDASGETGIPNTIKLNFVEPLDVDVYTITTPRGKGTFRISLKLSPVRVSGSNNFIIQLSCPIVGCTEACNYTVRDNYTGIEYKPVSAASAFPETGGMPNTFKLTFQQDIPFGTYQIETRNMQLWKNGIENSQPGEPCQGTIGYISVDSSSGGGSHLSDREREEQEVIASFKRQYISPDMNDFEKEMQIIQWMVENIDYDYANYLNNTIPPDSYTSYGALVKKICVCDGYAKAFNKMASFCGLTTCYISGTGCGPRGCEDHAWNQIKLDGEWFNVDVTWEDAVLDDSVDNGYGFGNLCNSYINRTDEWFKRNHKWGSGHSCTSEKYGARVVSYYLKHGIYKSLEEMEDEDYNEEILWYTGYNHFFYPGTQEGLELIMLNYFETAIQERWTSVEGIKIHFDERLDSPPFDPVKAAGKAVLKKLNSKYKDILADPISFDSYSSSKSNGRYTITVPGNSTLKIKYKTL